MVVGAAPAVVAWEPVVGVALAVVALEPAVGVALAVVALEPAVMAVLAALVRSVLLYLVVPDLALQFQPQLQVGCSGNR